MAVRAERTPRRCSTICLPFDPHDYQDVVGDPAAFRAARDGLFLDAPARFPEGLSGGDRLQESRPSRPLRLQTRRVRLQATGEACTVGPSFALPYRAGFARDASGPLFLRAFGVPFWALARVFGRDPMDWCRLELSLGRNRVAGSTLRRGRCAALAGPRRTRRGGGCCRWSCCCCAACTAG